MKNLFKGHTVRIKGDERSFWIHLNKERKSRKYFSDNVDGKGHDRFPLLLHGSEKW